MFKPDPSDHQENLQNGYPPLKLVNRKTETERTVVKVAGAELGGPDIVIIAGPCSIESKEQLWAIGKSVKNSGARILRGGIYKPRTSPYSFQGLQDEGLQLLSWIRKELNLPVVTEVMDPRKLELVCQHADMIQIGSRNMHNTPLLTEVGQIRKPVLLKRGMAATIDEFLFAAEYIVKMGNEQVVLCERGIRTFETSTRFTLDISAIPLLKRLCHLPVIVDPSHGSGHWWMVPWLSKAALAAGADGLIIEVHHDPTRALCDGGQSLLPDKFQVLMEELKKLAEVMGRKISV